MTKVHHVAIDGMAAAELTRSLYDLTPNPRKKRSNHTEWTPECTTWTTTGKRLPW